MTWRKIMEMSDPHEALKAIVQKVEKDHVALIDAMEMVEKYAKLHKIEVDEMAFYPNGDRVIGD